MKTRTLRSRKGVKPTAPKAGRTSRTRARRTKTKALDRKTSSTRITRQANPRVTPESAAARSIKPMAARPSSKPAAANARLTIPPILLEGDKLTWAAPGPGQKFALGPTPAAARPAPETASLPEGYGTGKLTVIARDPHWLYAYWDLTPQQQRQYNALSTDRHLVVRVQPGTIAGHPSTEIHVHPESRSWFIHVEGAATRYSAELGYYPANRQWVAVAASAPAVTPPDTISRDKTLRFATIPPEASLRELAVPTRLPQPAELPLAGATQETALAEVMQHYQAQRTPASSAEVPELVRGPVQGEVSPTSLAAPVLPGAQIESLSSPLGGEAKPPKGFWLNLNAELILYGGTEPDATVTISGHPIALRPDGTFTFRFALPDGDYLLSVSAQSAGGESRRAHVRFTRQTHCEGEVGTAPQDPALKPPSVENL